jgi:NADH-quinone oxidoreductase subunit E
MAKIRVLEVATFYTMFNLSPVGRFHVQFCGTTPCMLRGADALKKVLHKTIGHENEVTADGTFSWTEVECLGACVNAPMVQINADYYEDLTPESLTRILNDLAAGRNPKPGPQVDRQNSAPIGGANTLTDPSIYQPPAPHHAAGAALQDSEAKKPGAPANFQEAPAPNPPLVAPGDAKQG